MAGFSTRNRLGLKVVPHESNSSVWFEVQVVKGTDLFHPHENPGGKFFTSEKIALALEKNAAVWKRNKGTLGIIALEKQGNENALEFMAFSPYPKDYSTDFGKLGIGAVTEFMALRHLLGKYADWQVRHGIMVSEPREEHLARLGIGVENVMSVAERFRRVSDYLKKRFE
ncbi:MAG: hypothetical protein V1811_00950 [Candidatus Micrarchaeota archaeon]